MLRVLLTIVVPLVLPTAIYLAWMRLTQSRTSTGTRWGRLPWVWLAATGTVLLVIVLFVVNVHFGSPQQGVYVPPRWEGGKLIPGHIEPTR
jgi:putative copper export protein